MPKLVKTEDLINSIVKMKVEKGASNKTILEFLQDDLEYGQSYAYEILREARKRIQEIWDKNAEAHLEESKGQLEELYEEAIRTKNGKLALEIRKEMNKLMGLYAAEKIELSGEIKGININIIKNNTEPDES
jgi:hypothetical protein